MGSWPPGPEAYAGTGLSFGRSYLAQYRRTQEKHRDDEHAHAETEMFQHRTNEDGELDPDLEKRWWNR